MGDSLRTFEERVAAMNGRRRGMRIAFDLDDTLIACEFSFPVEERGFLSRLLGHEEIRIGSIAGM